MNLVCKCINRLYSSHAIYFIKMLVFTIISIFSNQNATAESAKYYNAQINKYHPKPQFLFELYKNRITPPPPKKPISQNNRLSNNNRLKRKNKISTARNTRQTKKNNPNLNKNIYPSFTIPRTQTIKNTNDLDDKTCPKSISGENNPTNNDPIGKTSNTISYSDKKSEKYIWPVMSNKITFSPNNNGIDIFIPPDTAIRSAKDGIVIYAGNDLVDLGNTIIISHNNSISTVYGHASAIYVKKGQKVTSGQIIALSDNISNTKKSKLYFELRKDAVALDPIGYLEHKHNLKDNKK